MKVHLWKFTVRNKIGKLHHQLSLDISDSIKAIERFKTIVKHSLEGDRLFDFKGKVVVGHEYIGEFEHYGVEQKPQEKPATKKKSKPKGK